MNKQIFVINGSGGVGKDTFVEMVGRFAPVMNYSAIDKVKELARQIGWKGGKSERDRKFLSDLKRLTIDYCDMPFRDLSEKVQAFRADGEHEFLFLHVREPEEIRKCVDAFGARTVLVTRDSVKPIVSNDSDSRVADYSYHYVIRNDGTLYDLKKTAERWVSLQK